MSVKREKKLVDLFRFCEKHGLGFTMYPDINQVWVRNYYDKGVCFNIDNLQVSINEFGIEYGASIDEVLSKLKQLTPLWKKLKQIESN